MNNALEINWVAGMSIGDDALFHAVIDRPYEREVENKIVIESVALCDPFKEKYRQFAIWRPQPFRANGYGDWMQCRDCLVMDFQHEWVEKGFMEPNEIKTPDQIRAEPPTEHESISPVEMPAYDNKDRLFGYSYGVGMPLVTDTEGILRMKPATTSIYAQYAPEPISVPDVNDEEVYQDLLEKEKESSKKDNIWRKIKKCLTRSR